MANSSALKLGRLLRAVLLFLAAGLTREAVLGGDAVPDTPYYLSARSEDGGAILGEFFPFKERFIQADPGRIYDRFLKVTWITLPDRDAPNTLTRMHWEAASRLAGKLKARLPELNELKTLITRHSSPGTRQFIESPFFQLNSHSPRCWASDGAGLWNPYHRAYVDFARPEWDTTSMSEIYCVLLISTQ
jgi:hypothetical protein